MARCCGSTGSCVCKVVGGGQVNVSGTGSSQDPFVVEGVTVLTTQGTEQIDLVLTGDGTADSPWVLMAQYAPTATLDGLPDVDETLAPTNGQVLAYDEASGQWKPAAPTTAAAGAVTTGNSVEGDGSAGAPLDVTVAPGYYLEVRSNGLGLTDEAVNRLLRIFVDEADRTAGTTTLSPEPGTLSMREDNLGQIDYWNGTAWLPLDNGIRLAVQPGEMLALSGSYVGGAVFHYVAQISDLTDTNGDFTVIPSEDLLNSAGVLSVQVQELGTVPFHAQVWVDDVNGAIMGRAFRIDDGTAYAGITAEAVVTATLY